MGALSKQILKNLSSSDDQWPQIVDAFLVLMILSNVLAITLDAVYMLPESSHENVVFFNTISVFLFSIEYVYRVWSVAFIPDKEGKRTHPIFSRIKYMLTHLALIDLLVILPYYLGLMSVIDADTVQTLRLLWFFKLTRYNPKIPDIFLIVLIYLNILAVVLESVRWIHDLYEDWFSLFEYGCVAVFTIEYFVRIWFCPKRLDKQYEHPVYGRLQYMLSAPAMIDLFSVLPFYLSVFYGFDMELAQILRLLRVAKLTRYSSAMKLLLTVLRQELRTFGAALIILLVVAIFSAGIIYLVEGEQQPDKFGSIPAALYWSVITLTTIGYGDVYPITSLGKFFSGCIGITGIGMMALPAGILASAISDQIRRSREEYESKVEKVLREGKLSDDAIDELETTRENLGLKQDDAGRILDLAVHAGRAMQTCPHCGKPLTANKRKPRRSTASSTRRR